MNYTKSKEIATLGRTILKEDRYAYIREAKIRIGYMTCDEEKKTHHKTVYGECTKVTDFYKALVPYDFIITFFPPGIELDAERQKILMRHELLHIGIETNGELAIIPHDIEDFLEIIDRYGVTWERDDNG